VKFTEEYYERAYDYEEGEVTVPADPIPVDPNAPTGQPDPAKKANTGKGGDVKAALTFSSQFTPQQQAIEDAYNMADGFIDHVVSGLTTSVPGSGLVATFASGVAYANGTRFSKAGFTATVGNTTSYIDIDFSGTVTVRTGTTLTSNSLCICKIVASGGNITSVTQSGTDNTNGTGNPIYNVHRTPFCMVAFYSAGTQPLTNSTYAIQVAFGSGTTAFNNDNMHSEVSNNSRITVQRTGLYQVTGWYEATFAVAQGISYIYLMRNWNGSSAFEAPQDNKPWVNGSAFDITISEIMALNAGDYITLGAYQASAASPAITGATLKLARIG
jgi:hypothetical protein